ncbi:hypothetical protein DAPPUDRAFT_118339 [Daphnia pulex]|uniref:Uncharacterized protein n=1 Tax=Daphnia pulex TaxID=6669 RepID=E9HVG8_DAPPU|nr:hypothetical protein DAPPUDRAFT_118339 [Daphnia pulex]|eukprot:EFX64262.1 hypothetical protein DAPPUDRAFT_118339 [Daphnia pulex]
MQLSWNNFRVTLADKRQSLGYVISYIEAPYKNVSYFDRRDACGDGLESTIDVAVNHDAEPEENEMNTLLLISASLTLNIRHLCTDVHSSAQSNFIRKNKSSRCSFVVVSETKKPVLEETSPDNRTSIFGDPSIFAASPEGNNNLESGGSSGSAQQGKCCQCRPTGTNDKVTLEKKEK